MKHTLRSDPRTDERLENCKLCGSEMLGRYNGSRNTFVFSCSNKNCILHRNHNNIIVSAILVKDEDQAIEWVNNGTL